MISPRVRCRIYLFNKKNIFTVLKFLFSTLNLVTGHLLWVNIFVFILYITERIVWRLWNMILLHCVNASQANNYGVKTLIDSFYSSTQYYVWMESCTCCTSRFHSRLTVPYLTCSTHVCWFWNTKYLAPIIRIYVYLLIVVIKYL